MIFDYNIHMGFEGMPEVLAEKQLEAPISPNIITQLQKVEADEYNVYDTEYRRVINISSLTGQRRLSKGELSVRNAVEEALAADREIERIRRKALRDAKRASIGKKAPKEPKL